MQCIIIKFPILFAQLRSKYAYHVHVLLNLSISTPHKMNQTYDICSWVIYSLVRIYPNSPSHTVCYVYYPIYWLIDNPSKFIYPNHPHIRYIVHLPYEPICSIQTIIMYIYMFAKAGKSTWWCTENYCSCSRFIIICRSAIPVIVIQTLFCIFCWSTKYMLEIPKNWSYITILQFKCIFNLHNLITMWYMLCTRSSMQSMTESM